MDLNFFKQTRILDGGMGQELLARGMEPNGTLWSANALLHEKYHQLLLDTHLDFIKSGAEVIVTTTFTTRKIRLKDNNVELGVTYPLPIVDIKESRQAALEAFSRTKLQVQA